LQVAALRGKRQRARDESRKQADPNRHGRKRPQDRLALTGTRPHEAQAAVDGSCRVLGTPYSQIDCGPRRQMCDCPGV